MSNELFSSYLCLTSINWAAAPEPSSKRAGPGGRAAGGLMARADPGQGAWMEAMGTEQEASRVISVSREIAAAPELVFELIADPARQPGWDGNDNLAEAA